MKKSKKLAILAAVLGLSCGTMGVEAANLVGIVNTDASYNAGKISLITGSRVTTDVNLQATKDYVVDLNRDASLYPFVYQGNGMLGLRQYTYSTVDLAPTRFLDGNGNWNQPTYQGVTPSVANMHAAAGDNNFIYATGYDLGKLGVHKVQANGTISEVYSLDLKKLINEKCNGTLTSAAGVHGEALAVKDGMLYVTAAVNPSGGYGTYNNSYLMQFKIQADGSLEFVSYGRTAKNPNNNNICIYNNSIFTTGIGGSQGYGTANADTALSHLELVGGKIQNGSGANKINLPDNVKNNGSEFRNMRILPNGTAYVLMYVLGGAGATSDTKVYKTTVSNLLSANPRDWDLLMDEGTDGYFNNIDADYYTKRFYMECGNTVRIYTDGQLEPLIWTPHDLTNDSSYVNFNGWAVVPADQVTGTLAVCSDLHTTNVKQKTVLQADYRNKITGTSLDNEDSTAKRNYADATSDFKTYTFNSDKTIFTYSDLLGDLTTNVASAVSACDGNNINIQAGNNTLQLQSLNYVGNPTGIYAGYGKNVTVNAGKLNILTIGAENGNSLTNAIWLDAPANGSSSITINAPVDISMQGGLGGNAIAVQKTDRLGESSKEAASSSSITINGDVSVLGADSSTWGINCNKENVFSRFNSSGIYADVNKSKVTINGNVDFTVYGNGITTNAKDSEVSVKGGKIVVPKGMNYGYYSLASYLGNINMNADATSAGTNKVQLEGDVFALKTGSINLGLTTNDSYLKGIIDNGGTVNLSLKNGAVWTNEANNTRYAEDNEDVGFGQKSRVTKLTGGATKAEAGVIYQNSNSKDLLIDSYSGNSVVLYDHAADNSILGGNLTIGSAAAGSGITLRTDYASSMNTEAVQNKVLNGLANKLYYNAYVNGERNLNGKVEIAEGLTASSATKYVGGIAYDAKTGQGSLGTVAPEPSDDLYSYAGALEVKNNEKLSRDGLVEAGGAIIVNNGSLEVSNKVSAMGSLYAHGADIELGRAADISGALIAEQGSQVSIGRDASIGGSVLVDASSVDVAGALKAGGNINVINGGTLSAKGYGSDYLSFKLDHGTWINGSTAKSNVMKLKANAGELKMAADSGDLTLNSYEGNATVLYEHQGTAIKGGNLIVNRAATGSAITLQTDNSGIDSTNTATVNAVLGNLANKLYYNAYVHGQNNLQGTVKLAEGLTASSAAIKVGGITYDSATGQGQYVATGSKSMLMARKAAVPQENGSVEAGESVMATSAALGNIQLSQIEYGAEETAAMGAVKGALVSGALMQRAEANDLLKRMGDVRLTEEERGLWAKYYGGKYEMESANAQVSYKAYQLGYDTKAGKNWTVGGAVSYNEGKSGKTELKNTAVGVYGTWADDKGQYVDLITKIGWLKNDFDVATTGHKIEDSLKTTGMSMSAEYGKRFENKSGSFVEPNAELTFAHLNGKKVNAKVDGGSNTMGVDQDAFNSLVGRLGLRIGHKSAKSSVYAKVALAHEFAGDFDVTFSAPSEPTKKVSVDLKDTWGEFQIGGTTKVGKAGLLYANYQRSFAGEVKEKYRVDAGLRWSF